MYDLNTLQNSHKNNPIHRTVKDKKWTIYLVNCPMNHPVFYLMGIDV